METKTLATAEITDAVLQPWAAIDTALGLAGPVRDASHHAQLLAFVDGCFERFGGDEGHAVFALVGLAAERIRAYENANAPWLDTSTPASRLAFLMEQHGLRQCDLPEVGAQSVVSKVLAGKRQLNLRQVRALALRFAVPLEVLSG